MVEFRRNLMLGNKKTLSQTATEVLNKSVVQAIPTYAMSCFLLPTASITDAITSLVRQLWWGGGH